MYEPFLSLLDLAVPWSARSTATPSAAASGSRSSATCASAREDAKYGANFVKLGLAPGMAISYLLPRLDRRRARERAAAHRPARRRPRGRSARHPQPRGARGARCSPWRWSSRATIAGNAPLAVRATKAAIRRGPRSRRPRGRARRGVRAGGDARDRRLQAKASRRCSASARRSSRADRRGHGGAAPARRRRARDELGRSPPARRTRAEPQAYRSRA